MPVPSSSPEQSKNHFFPSHMFGLSGDRHSTPSQSFHSQDPLASDRGSLLHSDNYSFAIADVSHPTSTLMAHQESQSSGLSPLHDHSLTNSTTTPMSSNISSMQEDIKYSSQTTPSFDPDFPFDLGGMDNPEDDNGNTQTQNNHADLPNGRFQRTTTNSSRETHLPTPTATNNTTPSPMIHGRKMNDPSSLDLMASPSPGTQEHDISSPTFTVEDHDDIESRRTKGRFDNGEAKLNRVLSAETFPHKDLDSRTILQDEEILSLKDLDERAKERERNAVVESWLTRSQSPGESVLGDSGKMSHREVLEVNEQRHHKRSRSVGDWRKVGQPTQINTNVAPAASVDITRPEIFNATEFPFEDFGPRTPGDVLYDGSTEDEESVESELDETDVEHERNEVHTPDAPMLDDPSIAIPHESPFDKQLFSDDDNMDTLSIEQPRRIGTNMSAFPEDDDIPMSASKFPHPEEFYYSVPRPWNDVMANTTQYDKYHNTHGYRGQPATANAAILRMKMAADKFETASRVATFGSIATQRQRRLSAGEIEGLPGIFKRMSFGREKETLNVVRPTNNNDSMSDRKQSMTEMKNELKSDIKNVLKRFSSAGSEHHRPVFGHTSSLGHGRHGSSSSTTATLKNTEPSRRDSKKSDDMPKPRRFPSIGRKLSNSKRKQKDKDEDHSVDMKSAFARMAGPLMTVGGGEGGISAAPAIRPTTGKSSVSSPSRHGSQSSTFSPTLPRHTSSGTLTVPPTETYQGLSDEEPESDAPHETFSSPKTSAVLSVPKIITKITVAGRVEFSRNCLELFPQLESKLADRIAAEQVKKYNRLLDMRQKHERTVKLKGSCANETKCTVITGQGRERLDSAAGHVPNMNNVLSPQYDDDSEDENGDAFNSGDGRVTASHFPFGVPVPPVTRLPAEFECPICFKLKRFQKPSDWTKHVHEDVMPFTCTFLDCTDPKSFKRKADWVRHENEKHRHLEWWTCNMPDCPHVCYRKDNFVQHLVREHKFPEVKVKGIKMESGTPARSIGRKPGVKRKGPPLVTDPSQVDAARVWDIVAECHKETSAQSKDEPCRFCGERLPNWKKLTVHIARHMERISLPVLDLIGDESVVSPRSIKKSSSATTSPTGPMSARGFDNISPVNNMSIDETLNNDFGEVVGMTSPVHDLSNMCISNMISPGGYYNNGTAQPTNHTMLSAGANYPAIHDPAQSITMLHNYVHGFTQSQLFRQDQSYQHENAMSFGPSPHPELVQSTYMMHGNLPNQPLPYSQNYRQDLTSQQHYNISNTGSLNITGEAMPMISMENMLYEGGLPNSDIGNSNSWYQTDESEKQRNLNYDQYAHQ